MENNIVYVLTFNSYDSGNQILGVFDSEAKAESYRDMRIEDDKFANPDYPRRYEQQEYRYHIEEFEIMEL